MKFTLRSLFVLLALLAGVNCVTTQGSSVFPIAINGSGSQAGLFAAFNGTNYLVGIQGDGTTNSTVITSQLISTNGVVIGPRNLTGRTGGIPYVASGGTNFLLLWSDDKLVAGGGNDQVYGQFINPSGVAVGNPFTFGPTNEEQDMQGGGGSLLAFDGKNYLAVWDTGGFYDASSGNVHAALFNQNGSLVVPIISITSGDNAALTPTVTFGKTNYLVVWNDELSGNIDGELISTNGKPGTAFVINQTTTSSYDPCCVAFDGTNFMVVWNKNTGLESPNTSWILNGRVVSTVGTFLGSEVAMITNQPSQGYPSLAFDGTNYLLALNVGGQSPNAQILCQFFNQILSPIGPQFYPFQTQGTNVPGFGGVLYDGGRFEITAIVGAATGIGSDGFEFTSGTGTYGAFLGTVPPTNINPPVLAITTPASGQILTNSNFAATGTTTGNAAVAEVFYSLNNGVWNKAVTTNNWTNWIATLSLVPGTDTISAYAVDNSGNLSITNSVSFYYVASGGNSPVIDPIPNATIPAGKSLILPITATSSSGFPLTYTITSSTNAFAVVMHTNNPFWQLTVAQTATNTAPGAYQTPYRGGLVTVTNVGTLTFELFPEYAPHTVNVFQGLTTSGFYNSNTIFHRVVSDFVIQGGDPGTNGTGGLVFQYNDEFNPQAIFSGNGQLALANSGPNTDGSQFFVTVGQQRFLDFTYTLFGQLVRGYNVLTNINSTAVDTNSFPLAREIIQTAAYVTNTTDTVVTLCATNLPGVKGTITVIADDGQGGRTTNTFAATTVTDASSNGQPLFYPINQTNLVVPVNTTLTNYINVIELDGNSIYWYPEFADNQSQANAGNSAFYEFPSTLKTLTYNVTNSNGQFQLIVVPNTNYAGPINFILFPSSTSGFTTYAKGEFSYVFGDTPIIGQTNTLTVQAGIPFENLVLATFTNGVPGSPATNFTAVINWGDNSTNTATATGNAAGVKAIAGAHSYPYPGSYPVYVTVQSSIGANATLVSYVNVTNYPAPITNLFTVMVNGSGTVSPAYSSTPLVVGNSYTVTASPSPLWLFSGWTDENGFVVGTSTNLAFTLNPGLSLTATFLQAAPPTLAITSPANGSFFTNLYSALATMTGTISNNATVTNVYFQLNGGGWQSAVGTTNWTASFSPVSGISNVLQAYAINNFGYLSATSTILVKYLAGDVLTLSTNGLGSILPDLNGDLLPLGSNYTLTATPATGFTFAHWSGSLYTNNAILSFTMATNLSLVANFADGSSPKLTITSPTTGQQVKSNQFNVLGTSSSDNWIVANVLYALNNSTWTNASSANNWTNWNAPVTLAPGTNTFYAYAVDPNGKPSLTNTVNFQYLVTNQLQIQSFGKGTLSPNDSNAWLNIGQNYAITATAASGFAFTNWTISTNFTGGITTNSPTVQFAMASNLTLQINFAETAKPALAITWPAAAQHLTNALPNVAGTASDNWGVASVAFQLNGGAWYAPGTTNVWTNWNTVVQMNAGSNTFSAYAVNLGGNYSTTSSISVFSSNAFKLQLSADNFATKGFNFSLAVSTNLYGHIQYSTNLAGTNAWSTLTNFAGTNATLNFLDAAATNNNQRYYRAVIP